jgi:hypothetical protein
MTTVFTWTVNPAPNAAHAVVRRWRRTVEAD